jgi:hypothetical protein
MSLITAVIAQAFARQRGLSPDATGRVVVTGYALGSVASPLASALVVNQLVEREQPPKPAPSSTPQLPEPSPPVIEGPPGIKVGEFVGKPYAEFRAVLVAAGVQVEIYHVKGSDQAKDTIDSAQVSSLTNLAAGFQKLEAGDTVRAGDLVRLAISLGELARTTPNVVGDSAEKAQKTIEGAGLKFASQEEESVKGSELSRLSAGIVLYQSPAAGTHVAEGATIVVTTLKSQSAAQAAGTVAAEEPSFGSKSGSSRSTVQPSA